MAHIGDKIRELREKKGISRPNFCGDESELSVRQLLRIENGESNPNIEKIQFIADKLQVPTYQLMLDYYELPARYKELKYLILRQPVYGEREPLEQKERYLEEIFKDFYEDLPEEEQEVIDYLNASNQLDLTNDLLTAKELVEESISKFENKEYFTLNELSFISLLGVYFLESMRDSRSISVQHLLVFEDSVSTLLKQKDFFSPETLFVYSNCLFTCLCYYNKISDFSKFQEVIDVLNCVLEITQDFQKKSLLCMLEWKVSLFEDKDFSQASLKYQEAKIVAQALNLLPVLVGLDQEWKKDLERFYQDKENFN